MRTSVDFREKEMLWGINISGALNVANEMSTKLSRSSLGKRH